MQIPEIINPAEESVITTTRVFNYPQQTLYNAWALPQHIKNWWGPKGFTNTFHVHNPVPGGAWNFIMHGPDGTDYLNECTFIKNEEPSLLIWNHDSNPKFQVEVRFEAVSDNQTRLNWKMKFFNPEQATALRNFIQEKNEENMERLEVELERMG
jgi:uncharacterized protein YndB with AHSA1/START domain